MSPDARLAQLARVMGLVTRALLAVIVAGIAVSSVNVQHNMAAT